MLHSGLAELNERQSTARTRRGEFEGLREFRPGDDPRDIHWRTSARRGRHFVRQFEGNTGRVVVVALDDAQPRTLLPGGEPSAPFEAAVSLAASAALVLLRHGYQVGLATSSGFLPPGAGNIQASHILRSLALVEMRPAFEPGNGIPTHPAALQGAAVLHVLQGPQAPRLQASRPAARRPS
jgi:uncharacterized protein (DUF58 family)